LITISTPVYVWNLRQILRNITNGSKRNKTESLKWYLYSATSFPLSALIHFQLLLYKTKAMFPQISCPICILQGLDDDTVNSKSASYIYNKVSSPKKELHFFENSGHVVLKGPASEEALLKIQHFIDSTL
jgi:carboxylesterase